MVFQLRADIYKLIEAFDIIQQKEKTHFKIRYVLFFRMNLFKGVHLSACFFLLPPSGQKPTKAALPAETNLNIGLELYAEYAET